MDATSAAQLLLKQTIMLELAKSAFKDADSQIVSGLFEQVLAKALVKRDGL